MNNENFFSIDRLVEFGLGVGVAQQMVKSMNHALTNTHIPGTMNPMDGQRVSVALYVVLDNKVAGPFTEGEMARLISNRQVTKLSYVWKAGMPNWGLAENVPEVLKLVALCPPPFAPMGEPL